MSWYMNNMAGRRPKNMLPNEQREDAFAKIVELVGAFSSSEVAERMRVSRTMVNKWAARQNGMDAISYRKLKNVYAELMGVSK